MILVPLIPIMAAMDFIKAFNITPYAKKKHASSLGNKADSIEL